MGRQREFDLDKSMAIATDMFWQQGYDNTSVGQLTQAMGITAPSFYLAFSSKEALFRKVVTSHQERQAQIIESAFEQPDSRKLVSTLLQAFADDLTMPGRAPGCLIMNNALPVAGAQGFRGEWAEWRNAFRRRLQKRFGQEQRAGRLRPDSRPAALAEMVVALIWGFAVEAQAGVDRKQLHQTVAEFMEMWPSPL